MAGQQLGTRIEIIEGAAALPTVHTNKLPVGKLSTCPPPSIVKPADTVANPWAISKTIDALWACCQGKRR
jgi:hypothetical protein